MVAGDIRLRLTCVATPRHFAGLSRQTNVGACLSSPERARRDFRSVNCCIRNWEARPLYPYRR